MTSAIAGSATCALPGDLARLLVGRDQPAIQRVRDDLVLPQRDAAVVDAAARDRARPVLVGARIHLPRQLARALGDVELVDRPPAVGDVHEAVLDDRGALEAAVRPDAAALDAAQREGPGDFEVLHVLLLDLVERGVPGRRVVLVVGEPVLGLGRRVEQPLRRRVARRQGRDRDRAREQGAQPRRGRTSCHASCHANTSLNSVHKVGVIDEWSYPPVSTQSGRSYRLDGPCQTSNAGNAISTAEGAAPCPDELAPGYTGRSAPAMRLTGARQAQG